MKRYVTILLAVLGVLVFGGSVGATTVWWAYDLNEHAEGLKSPLKERYESSTESVDGEKVQVAVTEETKRISEEAYAYLDAKISEQGGSLTEREIEEVHKLADEKIEQLKGYIDELVAN